MLLWLAWLLAYQSTWTVEGAVAPTLQRMDTNGDHQVDRAEYERVRARGQDIDAVDRDGSGTLDLPELVALLTHQDPRVYAAPYVPPLRMRPHTDDLPNLIVDRKVLQALVEELRAAHDATAPTDEEIEAAAAAGLLAPEGTALLDRIEAGYARAGLRFPATVRPAPATAPPTTPTTPP